MNMLEMKQGWFKKEIIQLDNMRYRKRNMNQTLALNNNISLSNYLIEVSLLNI